MHVVCKMITNLTISESFPSQTIHIIMNSISRHVPQELMVMILKCLPIQLPSDMMSQQSSMLSHDSHMTKT